MDYDASDMDGLHELVAHEGVNTQERIEAFDAAFGWDYSISDVLEKSDSIYKSWNSLSNDNKDIYNAVLQN